MGEAKPTPGAWLLELSPDGGWCIFVEPNVDMGAHKTIASRGQWNHNIAESHANAALFHDAGTVFHTTGVTPSQLVERVKELEEALTLADLLLSGANMNRANVELKVCAALSKARPKGEAHADSVREDAALLSLLEELSDHDSYDTEYDGRMISLCPECGSQDGEHSKNCAFRRAKEYLAARKQAAAKEPSP